MSTDIDYSCVPQDDIPSKPSAPGFSVLYTTEISKLVPGTVFTSIPVVIANSPTSTDYNTGMYNAGTGDIIVPVVFGFFVVTKQNTY